MNPRFRVVLALIFCLFSFSAQSEESAIPQGDSAPMHSTQHENDPGQFHKDASIDLPKTVGDCPLVAAALRGGRR